MWQHEMIFNISWRIPRHRSMPNHFFFSIVYSVLLQTTDDIPVPEPLQDWGGRHQECQPPLAVINQANKSQLRPPQAQYHVQPNSRLGDTLTTGLQSAPYIYTPQNRPAQSIGLGTLAMDNHLNNLSIPIFRHANSLKATTAHDFCIPSIQS